jgi:hypothetical protein
VIELTDEDLDELAEAAETPCYWRTLNEIVSRLEERAN